jgi:hypothetical protein
VRRLRLYRTKNHYRSIGVILHLGNSRRTRIVGYACLLLVALRGAGFRDVSAISKAGVLAQPRSNKPWILNGVFGSSHAVIETVILIPVLTKMPDEGNVPQAYRALILAGWRGRVTRDSE